MRPDLVALATAVALAVTAVSCDPPPRHGPIGPTPSHVGPTSGLGAPTARVVIAPSPSLVVAPAIAVDDTLLELLPNDVGGVPLTGDPATAAEIAVDPSLTGFVAAVAVAAAFAAAPTEGVGDYVVVTLARLDPGVFGDAFFRDWRDTFDGAVCAQAGGVAGHAEAEIASHRTYITTCAGGVRTYHVHLDSSGVIVSMQAVGDGRFGERVVEGLTE